MKLRNKILAFAAPVAAVTAVMPIALTSCSVSIEAPSLYLRTVDNVTFWQLSGGSRGIDTKTKFITNVSAKVEGSNRITFLAQPKGSDKYLKTASCSVNGKALKVHEVKNTGGQSVWVCDSTETFTVDADLKLEFKFAESGSDCTILIAIGVAS